MRQASVQAWAAAGNRGLLLSALRAFDAHRLPMTPRLPTLRLAILLLLVAVMTTSGCARLKGIFKDEDANEGVPVEALYDKGHRSMRNGNWSGAATTYRRLVAQYPYGPYTEQALMETAYAQFKMGDNEEAISSIDRFIRTYPTHRNIAYMYYLRGLVNANRDTVFLQRVWRLDASHRDLATPLQGYNDFSIVAERYPNSRYAADARQRMVALRNTFARHEIETALYYLRRDAWVAAANRAKYLIETYPQSEYQNDAVAVMAAAYTELGQDTLAADARRVLQQNEPGHPYLAGDWPDYPSNWRKLNPFAGERSAIDNDAN
jgi:outer membrane protein assembly factor BamD